MSNAKAYLAEKQESEDRVKATVMSFVIHVLIAILLYFYKFGDPTVVDQPQSIAIELEWGGGGDNAAAGEPDKGMNDDYTPPGNEEPIPVPSKATPPPPTAPVAKPEPVKATPPSTPTTEDPNVAAVRKQQEDQRKREQEAARQRAADEAQKQAVAEAAERARQEDAARKAKVKNNAGSAFGKPGSTGTGAGGGGKPGNGGVAGGTGDNPFGKSNGTGGGTGGGSGGGTGVSIGGGLGGRAVRFRPTIRDNSQETGKVVVEVCVDSEGNVTSSNYLMRGSTTQSTTLRSIAEREARKFKFAASNSPKDCGTIAFNFQVQ